MFVIDARHAGKEGREIEEKIEGLVNKVGGEVVGMKRWDERKLAYEIKGCGTGIYMLTYFKGEPDMVQGLNRECKLSPFVLRLLALKVNEIPDIESIETASEAGREGSGFDRSRVGSENRPVKKTAGRETEAAGRETETAGRETEAAGRETEAAGRETETAGDKPVGVSEENAETSVEEESDESQPEEEANKPVA